MSALAKVAGKELTYLCEHLCTDFGFLRLAEGTSLVYPLPVGQRQPLHVWLAAQACKSGSCDLVHFLFVRNGSWGARV
jgi:hypothetical protein